MRNRDMPATACPDSHLAVGGTGLTKREAAAIAAMQGMMQVLALQETTAPPKGVAQLAVQYADALFDELEKGDG